MNNVYYNLAVILYVYAVVYVVYYRVVATVYIVYNVALVAVNITKVKVLLGRTNIFVLFDVRLRRVTFRFVRFAGREVAHALGLVNKSCSDGTHKTSRNQAAPWWFSHHRPPGFSQPLPKERYFTGRA